ncbi:LysR family transcriptional regulator [Paenirhodobacter populi]|uniref:LysR family transcriptional regulator n=1 Tax=Paenirhodobacter populi TaxID=2306993 RepID=A0A443JEQ2_9RHOB|nr:LysR family transcriptional regulator [Sinirhodobacter populi]RWR19035.1 LysR family transcriptional regulator [Sinirhodobacter populi]
MFDWDDLPYFLAVARFRQLSAAGRQIGTSHVTVARRIDRLEARMKMRLFDRAARGYELTPQGRRMLPAAERMEREAERLREEMSGTVSGHRGVFRISMPEGFASFFCQHLRAGLMERFPNLWLELVTLPQVGTLSRREADLMIALDPTPASPYHSEALGDYMLRVYGSETYLRQAPPIRERGDLLAHPFIGYIEDMIFARGLDYLEDVHPGIRCNFKSSSIFSQLAVVSDGAGLGVLPCFLARRLAHLVPVLPGELVLRRTYWMTCHRDVWQSPIVRQVSQLIRDGMELHRHRLIPVDDTRETA